MAHLYQEDGKPGWYCRWSFMEPDAASGKAKRLFQKRQFDKKGDALAYKRQIEDRSFKGLDVDQRAGRETVEAWAERWFTEYARTVKPSTARKSRGLLDATVIPRLGHLPMRDVRTTTVADWLDWIERTRVSRNKQGVVAPATIRHHYLVLRNVLRFARREGAIYTNPADDARLPTNKTRGRIAREPRFLTPDEVAALADELVHPYDLLVQFLAFTGLRVGECSGLNIADVDLDRMVVHVRRTRTKRACSARCMSPDCSRRADRDGRQSKCAGCAGACNGADCCWEVHTPKSGRPRTTPLPAALGVALRDYQLAHPRGDDSDAPFWPGRSMTERSATGNSSGLDYDKPWNRSAFYKGFFRPALKDAGLPEDVRLHDLRHSFASICASSGVPAAQVAEWMGHSNEIVTRTIYTHLFKEDTSRHAEALSNAFRPTRPRDELAYRRARRDPA
jgi:integrase